MMEPIPMENVSTPSTNIANVIHLSEDNFTSTPNPLEDFRNSTISLRGVYKRYGKNIILNNLNMNVPDGCIYGLLGPSGCGKTTLLNCIMGISNIDIGEISVKYSKVSDVGLMPQDNALIPNFNIKETFYYFGKMFAMSDKQVKTRAAELSKLLELPDPSTQTDNLSGGLQRRMSLAVALLHDPKMLLLDEPTVGLDPLISKSIWDYLTEISSKMNKTIIITTHYIEEAKRANYVGLMRGGNFIEQGTPSQLMDKYNADTLEDIFLLISTDHERSSKENLLWPKETPATPPLQTTFNKRDRFSIDRFKAQFYKNTLFLVRQTLFMVLIFGLPVLQTNTQYWALGGDPQDLKLAIVNFDTDCSNYDYTRSVCQLDNSLSCRYLHHVQHTRGHMQFIYKNNVDEGKQSVLKHETWGMVHFRQNFSTSLLDRVENFIRGLPEDVIDSSTVDVYLDMTDRIIESYLKAKLTEKFFDFMRTLYRDCGWPDKAASIPIRVNDPVFGEKHAQFTDYQIPIFVTCFAFFLPLLMTPAFLLHEKLNGCLQRCIFSGLTTLEMILALVLLEIIIMTVQMLTMSVILYVIYYHPPLSNLAFAFTLLFLQGVSGILLGVVISIISDSYLEAFLGGNCLTVIITFTTGIVWPLEGAHPLLYALSLWLPLGQSPEAFRSIVIRGWPLEHKRVYYGYLSVFGWIVIFIIMMYISVKNKKFIIRK